MQDEAVYDVPTWTDHSRTKATTFILAVLFMAFGIAGLSLAVMMGAPKVALMGTGVVALASMIIGLTWIAAILRG